jgi:hypothetical protein
MNNEAVQSRRFAPPALRPASESIAAAVFARVRLVLAHIRESVTAGGSTTDRDDLAGMNARMLRDIGAETSFAPRPPTMRDQYPRL